jgi:hypothetical protein
MEWLWSRKKKDTASNLNDGRIYLRDEFARERLLSIDLSAFVVRPKSIEYNEWLATHVIWFAEHVNLMCGALSEFCQLATCPAMTVPGNVLQWIDEKNKKRSCSAPDYINLVMSFTHGCLKDESIFPTKYGQKFSSDIEAIMRKMVRLLLHVVGHIYHAHYQPVVHLGLHPHLNTVTYHLVTFAHCFHLVDERDLQPLTDLYGRLHHFAAAAPRRLSNPAVNSGGTSPWTDGSTSN